MNPLYRIFRALLEMAIVLGGLASIVALLIILAS